MIINLHVKNFAIIKDINVDFDSGFNILSGETGSGKSLVLKAISFLKGDKFNKDYLGSFDDKTYIEAVFTSNSEIDRLLTENGYELNENIIISRTFTVNSSVSKINNKACNIKFLNQITNLLFDIHGQHSQLIILDKSNYIDLIDKFNIETVELKNKISNNLKLIKKLNDENGELNLSDDEIEREKDLLNYQINEIEKFNFENYDEESLNKEYKKLSNQSTLIKGVDGIMSSLIGNSRSDSLMDYMNNIYNSLCELQRLDEDLANIVSDALNIKELIKDLSINIERYSYTLEIDEERIKIIEDIFSDFQILKLKYGRNEEEILDFLFKIKSKYKLMQNIHQRRIEIKQQIITLEKNSLELADKLTLIRSKIIDELEIKIVNELKDMNMENIKFRILLTKLDEIKSNGQDSIDFLISTNKGHELKSLSQVSSGGEISRFMLALKAVFIEKDEIDTIIFDEIDTGISGKTADIVGNKIRDISMKTQVIVISHLSQIASKARHHFLISKDILDDKTVTNIIKLNYEEKINEIARLISGSNITNNSIKSAIELLGGSDG